MEVEQRSYSECVKYIKLWGIEFIIKMFQPHSLSLEDKVGLYTHYLSVKHFRGPIQPLFSSMAPSFISIKIQLPSSPRHYQSYNHCPGQFIVYILDTITITPSHPHDRK